MMTDNEIIKALETCKEVDECVICPLRHEKTCFEQLSTATLDLINHQKAEIERLKAENEGYKHLDTILHTAIDELTASIKSEAIREFAERLKDMHKHNTTSVVSLVTVFDNINNLVKEMMEGENDKN